MKFQNISLAFYYNFQVTISTAGYKYNQRVVTRRGKHIQKILKSTSAFFEYLLQLIFDQLQEIFKIKASVDLMVPSGGYLASLLLAGYLPWCFRIFPRSVVKYTLGNKIHYDTHIVSMHDLNLQIWSIVPFHESVFEIKDNNLFIARCSVLVVNLIFYSIIKLNERHVLARMCPKNHP